MEITAPTLGRIVIYRTDGRNGLVYDLPAMINCTMKTHPGDYPDGSRNPLPVPSAEDCIHLTVMSPGGFGTKVVDDEGIEYNPDMQHTDTSVFVGAATIRSGSGTYVELDVPAARDFENPGPRTWRWPSIESNTIRI